MHCLMDICSIQYVITHLGLSTNAKNRDRSHKNIFLLVGLLERYEILKYLNGLELVTCYVLLIPVRRFGYDPFGLSKKPEDFAKYKVYELIHAKVGNAGAAGFIILEAFDDDKFGANCGPEAAWFKVLLVLCLFCT
ncbi:unnamed protein product [Musa acuminata var. zebrina]